MVRELRADLPVRQELQWTDSCWCTFIKLWFRLHALRDGCRLTSTPYFAFTLRNRRTKFLQAPKHLTVSVFEHCGASNGKAIHENW